MSFSILVVDDSPLIRKMMRRSIGLSKLDVGTIHEATNGKEALAVLGKEWIDVVFADLHMPEMTGFELIEHMSKDPVLCKIPVVVVTAERGEPALAHLKTLGITGHIPKPFTPETVLEVVNQLLTRVAQDANHAL